MNLKKATDALSQGREIICNRTHERIQLNTTTVKINFRNVEIPEFINEYADEAFRLADEHLDAMGGHQHKPGHPRG